MADSTTNPAAVLLLDPDPVSAMRRCGQLAFFGWQTFIASDQPDALDTVRRGPIDLALLHLPPADLLASNFIDNLRELCSPRYLPIVMFSDIASCDQRCMLYESGIDEIVSASIAPPELRARLRTLLRIKDLQDALQAGQIALQHVLDREHDLLQKLMADNHRLSQLAVTDPLTHLHNVRYFQKFLIDEFSIARRYNQSLSLLALDLDHFKQVNDRFGHPSGDYVLKEIAVILRQQVREADVVARTGGEEFSIILPRTDRVQADHFARRLRKAVASRAFVTAGQSIKVTVSVGLASYPQDADATSPETLIDFADQALLMAKQSGRNCVIHWFEMDGERKSRLRNARHSAEPTPQSPAAIDANYQEIVCKSS